MQPSVREYLQSVDRDCVRCGICTKVQCEYGQNSMMFGDIAASLLKTSTASPEITDFARACLTCGRCTADCPVDIRGGNVSIAARSVIADNDPDIVAGYRRYRCDLDDSMFNRMRNVTGGEYDEFLPLSLDEMQEDAASAGVLFFPGCTLANNFPGLCKKTYDQLKSDGLADHITTLCCGRPLGLTGLEAKRVEYEHALCTRIAKSGVTKVVTACPNCYYELRRVFADEGISKTVELAFLAEVLADAGYRFEPSDAYPMTKVAMHDSCPDRHDGVVAKSVRRLFENVEVVETENSQQHSVCCGSGGFASVYKQDICQNFFTKGVSEFFGTGAKCLVSACANCASAYKFSGAVRATHYLEMLFGTEMDMDAYGEAINRLWNPESPDSLENFASDKPLFAELSQGDGINDEG